VIGNLGGDIDVQIVYLGPAVSPVLGPLDVYDVHLVDVGTPNDSISAVDVDIIPDPATNPLGLAQGHAFGGAIATPDMQFASMLVMALPYDTHFNLWNAGAANFPQWSAAFVPANENILPVGPNPAGELEGWGTTLNAISALTPIATDLNLVQVGVPAGTRALLTGTAADGSVQGEVFTFGIKGQTGIIIPEPATVGLLLLGGLGLLSRKRRS
jgi:hypothetical protein